MYHNPRAPRRRRLVIYRRQRWPCAGCGTPQSRRARRRRTDVARLCRHCAAELA